MRPSWKTTTGRRIHVLRINIIGIYLRFCTVGVYVATYAIHSYVRATRVSLPPARPLSSATRVRYIRLDVHRREGDGARGSRGFQAGKLVLVELIVRADERRGVERRERESTRKVRLTASTHGHQKHRGRTGPAAPLVYSLQS